jgi:hypothetical protein
MKDMGLSISQIAEATGLSPKVVKKINGGFSKTSV